MLCKLLKTSEEIPTACPKMDGDETTLCHDIDSLEPDTPSKWMWIMHSKLGATSSGSMLGLA
jgi:hypothetical protein